MLSWADLIQSLIIANHHLSGFNHWYRWYIILWYMYCSGVSCYTELWISFSCCCLPSSAQFTHAYTCTNDSDGYGRLMVKKPGPSPAQLILLVLVLVVLLQSWIIIPEPTNMASSNPAGDVLIFFCNGRKVNDKFVTVFTKWLMRAVPSLRENGEREELEKVDLWSIDRSTSSELLTSLNQV